MADLENNSHTSNFTKLSGRQNSYFTCDSCVSEKNTKKMCIGEAFIDTSNYTATGGGLPKAIRGNCTHMALWRTKNIDELNLIAKEMAGEVSPEKNSRCV